jgi:hypothetical protein
LRIRSLEEAYAAKNYFAPAGGAGKGSEQHRFREQDRSYGMQKIFSLHEQKGYKPESLFVAAAIFDHYIMMMGVHVFRPAQVLHLAVISVLMAAKLEQPISPSFNRMINLLPDEERKYVSKKQLI